MESYFHIDLNDENYMEQIQNMVNQLQNSIITYQNNNPESQNQSQSENGNQQNNYLIQFEFDIDNPNNFLQEELPNYFKNSNQIDQELGKALYITKNDEIIGTKECLICLEKFEYKKYKRLLKCCNNIYHKTCIDKWLKKNSSCPTCRFDLLVNKSNQSSNNLVQEEKSNEVEEEININIEYHDEN